MLYAEAMSEEVQAVDRALRILEAVGRAGACALSDVAAAEPPEPPIAG